MAPKNNSSKPLKGSTNGANRMPRNASQDHAGKRRVIEISSDDEATEPAPKVARSSTSRATNSSQPSNSQSTRDTWGVRSYHGTSSSQPPQSSASTFPSALDDERGVDDLVTWTQDDNATLESFEKYGTLNTKIVGLRYYNGIATVHERVLLKREPTNPFDRNAIRVDNVQRTQIGHIPKQVAAKLAPFMDEGALLLEARLAGPRGDFDCPLDLELYGTSSPELKEDLKVRLRESRLPVDDLMRREREQKQREKQREKERKQREKQQRQLEKEREKQRKAAELKNVVQAEFNLENSGTQQWSAGLHASEDPNSKQYQESLDDIATGSERYNPREMKEVVEHYGAGEEVLAKMATAEQPGRLNTQLLPYQLQGLAWLLNKEAPQLPEQGSKDTVQMWKRSTDNPKVFTNIATNFSEPTPKLASGGILADDMGLGKTLQVISLIVADLNLKKKPDDDSNATTLIVAPLSVMSNWSGQIELHVNESEPMQVLVYHGSTKKDMEETDFFKYDVVITTYGTLTNEYLPQKGGKYAKPAPVPRKKGLYSVKWRRIVLDEGHNIRNPQTKGALAATAIMARSRWVLTGTPIINTLKDLYSIIRFIGLTGGLERLDVFTSVLIRPHKYRDDTATLLLQALMATLCLRRRKDMSFVDLKLPKLEEYIHRIKFKDHEREKYDALQTEAKGYLRKYQARKESGSSSTQDTYRHLLEVLLRLRQVCNHWQLCGERVTTLMGLLEEQKTVQLNAENCKALQDMLQLSIESREDCPICLEELTGHNPVITHCAHVFGRECITRVIETQKKCPMCRAELPEENVLVEPARDLGAAESKQDATDDDSGPSSKVEALLNILAAAHRKGGTKLVVFSQWCRFLDLVEPHLDEAGYTYVRLDGSMNASARDASLRSLDQDPDTTILLASLGVASVGLNLTAANQVVLCDTWWAPAIEDQAVDRVHRLGQKKKCTVWRLIMEESIEDRTLEVQADKRKLMTQAFQENGIKRGQGSQARMGDIQRLLG